MKVIGLTGGIASGKSTVSRFLAELGAVVIDADKIGHEVLGSDGKVRRELTAAFGKQILTPGGSVSRRKLGKLVFADPEALTKLNRIMHPRIVARVEAQLERCRRDGVKVVVVEAALLLETGWALLVDEVWVTVANEAIVIKRLKGRSGLSKSESRARLSAQLPVAEMIEQADLVINTDCCLDELEAKVAGLWRGLDPAASQAE
ncbi:MAG: dephospho-CoA kinase [Dehalococcoidales bacterium]|nr:dephospho-CoA kinase [Dehalococcoidales bacterium]